MCWLTSSPRSSLSTMIASIRFAKGWVWLSAWKWGTFMEFLLEPNVVAANLKIEQCECCKIQSLFLFHLWGRQDGKFVILLQYVSVGLEAIPSRYLHFRMFFWAWPNIFRCWFMLNWPRIKSHGNTWEIPRFHRICEVGCILYPEFLRIFFCIF